MNFPPKDPNTTQVPVGVIVHPAVARLIREPALKYPVVGVCSELDPSQAVEVYDLARAKAQNADVDWLV